MVFSQKGTLSSICELRLKGGSRRKKLLVGKVKDSHDAVFTNACTKAVVQLSPTPTQTENCRTLMTGRRKPEELVCKIGCVCVCVSSRFGSSLLMASPVVLSPSPLSLSYLDWRTRTCDEASGAAQDSATAAVYK